jgi:hypothetical protein
MVAIFCLTGYPYSVRCGPLLLDFAPLVARLEVVDADAPDLFGLFPRGNLEGLPAIDPV